MSISNPSRAVETDLGAVSTPQHLVDYIVGRALAALGPAVNGLRVLEPACGDAIFLRTLRRTLDRDRLARCVGLDVDEDSCALAREALKRDALEQARPDMVDAGVDVIAGDFLLDDSWQSEAGLESFDLVIGNPPYVSTGAISLADKQALRARFRSARGRLDLYTLFIERSLELLAPGGVLAFVVPDKFLTTLSARSIREVIESECNVLSISRFSDHRIFPGADTVPCVVLLQRTEPDDSEIQVDHCEVSTEGPPSVVCTQTSSIPRRYFKANRPLSPTSRDVLETIDVMTQNGMRLGDEVTRISAGLATGLNAAYVMKTSLIEDDWDRAYLWPAIRGRDIRARSVSVSGLSVLIPYYIDDAGKPRLADLGPRSPVSQHLGEYREQLESRHCVRVWGKAWYDLHDPVSSDLLIAEKVLVPDVANESRFAVCPPGHVPMNSAYYLVPGSLPADVLAALLNSEPLAFALRMTAPEVKDGFRRFRKQFLEELPLPRLTAEFVEDVRSLVAQEALEDLDALVWELLGFVRAPRLRSILDGEPQTSAVVTRTG